MPGEELESASDAVCTALQLTNFWQDLAIDYSRGRLYLPREEWEAVGAAEADLAAGRLSPAWRAAVSSAAARTRGLFGEGRAVCDLVQGRLRYELRVTWLGGMLILDRLEETGYDVFTRRPTIGQGRRAERWRGGRCDGAGLIARPAAGPRRSGARGGARRGPMSRNTNFYYSFLVLTPAKRRAIIAVWDFCRAIDDTVDERAVRQRGAARRGVRGASTAWRKEIDAVFTPGVTPATPQGRALQPLARLFRLPRRPLEDLDRRRQHGRRLPPLSHVQRAVSGTCYKVASTVGLICVEIFGCREAASRDYAVDLGIALQLTNILRDVKADLERGRLYIPLDDLDALQLHRRHDPRRLAQRTRSPRCCGIRRARAREYYQRASRGLPRDDARRLVAAEIMSAIYRAILDEIELRDYDVFSEVVRIPDSQRVSIAFRTWLRIMTGRRVALEPVRHA